MSESPKESELPQDEHLREDINATGAGDESAAEFSEASFTSTLLNAGQRVPGLSPGGEYRHDEKPEEQTEAGEDGLAAPEES